jgi:hypothetical protein
MSLGITLAPYLILSDCMGLILKIEGKVYQLAPYASK